MKCASVLALWISAACVVPAQAQESSRAEFSELQSAIEGRWVGEVTWVADWPGFGKRGDKVTCYAEITRTEDGHASTGRFFGGVGSGTWLTYYDAGAKQIKEVSISSGGIVWHVVYIKQGTTWLCRQTGSNPDGGKLEAEVTLTISDDGNTHTYTGTTTIDGEQADELHDVWRRVSK